MQTKVCTKCSKDLPLEAFGKHSRYKFGRRYICRDCRAKCEPSAKWQPRWQKPYKTTKENIARVTLRQAVYHGRIEKPRHCEHCGQEIEKRLLGAHHFAGYDDPFKVIWLCIACHNQEHRAAKHSSANAACLV